MSVLRGAVTAFVTAIVMILTMLLSAACMFWLLLPALDPHAPKSSPVWGLVGIAILIAGISAGTLLYLRLERWTFSERASRALVERLAMVSFTLVMSVAPYAFVYVLIR